MDVTYSPYFEPTLQQLDRVMLAQHGPPMPSSGAAVPSDIMHSSNESKEQVSVLQTMQHMFNTHVIGLNGQHLWFWAFVLFLFGVVMLGLHVFQISKLDELLATQKELMNLMRKLAP